METSILIAKLAGPVMVVMAFVLLKDPKDIRAIGWEFINNRSLLFVAGTLSLLGGLAIVIHHNIWVGDWRVLITVIGWAMIVGGIIRLALPKLVKTLGAKMLNHNSGIVIAGLVWLALGAFLSFVGYA